MLNAEVSKYQNTILGTTMHRSSALMAPTDSQGMTSY